ncbi:MAG: hypothetical protein KA419_17965 [Acidobacteria bacterium]|nr:hypothetical protein [Acidobacteriota bacterium]
MPERRPNRLAPAVTVRPRSGRRRVPAGAAAFLGALLFFLPGCSGRVPVERIDAGVAAMESARQAGADKLVPRTWEALVKKKAELDGALSKGETGEAARLARELMDLSSQARVETQGAARRAEANDCLSASRSSLSAARQAMDAVVSPRSRAAAEYTALQSRLKGLEQDLLRVEGLLRSGDLDGVKTGAATIAEASERVRESAVAMVKKKARPAAPAATEPPPGD